MLLEKSIFYGNTLSSLLRSNSVISAQKSDEEISSENRPILHPPPTENELAPTRSVLDVLKEISRKRINSDVSIHIKAYLTQNNKYIYFRILMEYLTSIKNTVAAKVTIRRTIRQLFLLEFVAQECIT